MPTTSPQRARRHLPPVLAFGLAGAIIGLALFASATPSPLYDIYAERWHFSTVVLTIVYAVYAFGVLGSLLLVGRISDQIGRRPVLLASIGTLLVAIVLFMLASSVWWLLGARLLQGLATGAAIGAAGAALLDLAPGGDVRKSALLNGAVTTFGIAFGALISSLLVQYVAGPRLTPYIVLFVLLALALIGVVAMPEPVTRAAKPRLRPQRPSVPPSARRAFLLASGGVIASWSVGGLYLTLAPSLTTEILHSHSVVPGGLAVFILAAAGGIAQLVWNRVSPEVATRYGGFALAAGMVALGLSLSTGSIAVFLITTGLTGIGFGLTFMGAIRSISTAVPPEQRGAVMSAFYVVAYLAISVPAVLAGLAVSPFGLDDTFRVFAGVVALIAIATAVAVRPEPKHEAAEVGPAPAAR